MLQVARLAPQALGESTGLVRDFLLSQQNGDGGFKDRAGRSDLYYTVFGIDGLIALQADWPHARVEKFLCAFGAGEELDFVHLCCLARCWATVWDRKKDHSRAAEMRNRILQRIETFRARDGGYRPMAGSDGGTAYGAFLALGARQDLRADPPDAQRLVESLSSLRTADGAWTNEPPRPAASGLLPATGSTNATAAAISVLRNLGAPMPSGAGAWLLAQAHPQGGFRAAPQAPLPDLLSTATALHALAGLQISFAHLKEACLDFIDTLWTNEGGFYGHWGDDTLDCEYTFYALLALGHLSL